MRDIMLAYPILSTTLLCVSMIAIGATGIFLIYSMAGPGNDD